MDRIEDFEVNSPRWLLLEDFEGEIWRPIDEFKDWYEVSNYGRVRTIERRVYRKGRGNSTIYRDWHPHIMKAHDNENGYLLVTLGGKRIKKRYLHRLVETAFIPNPHNKNEVDHINTRKSDNRLCNLRWVNKSENALNPITRVQNSISQSEPVVILDCWGEYVGEYYGIQSAADALGLKRSVLNDAITRKRGGKTASGYTVVKKNEYDKDKDYSFKYKRGTSPFTNIPSDKMVLVFRDDNLYTVFPNTAKASDFYEVSVSYVSQQCRINAKGINTGRQNAFNEDKLYYLKDVSIDIQKKAVDMFKKKYSNA